MPTAPDIVATLLDPGFRSATFAGAVRSAIPCPWVRVVVRPLVLRGEPHLQFGYFDGRQTITKNYPPTAAGPVLAELVALQFAGIHIETTTESLDIRTTKKGAVHVGRRPADASVTVNVSHNRVKDLPLPEGKSDRLLEAMGILTAGGQVKPTMRAKFTQVNEFLKHLCHVLDEAEFVGLGRPIEILDCGSGSGFLTLAAHHYLNAVLGLPATVLGVDINDDVIRKSMAKVDKLGAAGLSFTRGRIGDLPARADIVIALHACDTATDDAIVQAIRGEARLFLGVPCCHRTFNAALRPTEPTEVLRPILRHGILKERTADLVTDAFRALALRIAGYRTDVVEFVGTEHTARNLLIRAVRRGPVGDPSAIAEFRDLEAFWGVTPYIERLLGDRVLSVPEGI